MKEKILECLGRLWLLHPITFLTTVGGFLFGLLVIIIGFWWTIFLILSVLGGFIAGQWLEKNDDRVNEWREVIMRTIHHYDEGIFRR